MKMDTLNIQNLGKKDDRTKISIKYSGRRP